MTIESALWMQNVDYPARLDRALIAATHDEGVLNLTSLLVAERAAGANFTVDVAAGSAVVTGDDEPNQGNYYVSSTGTESVTVTAAPGSNARIDRLVVQVNDANAGGAATNNVTLEIVVGAVSATPAAPAVPDSAISLALIGPITSSTASITDSIITDDRAVSGRKCAPATLEWRADGVVPSGWLASGLNYDPGVYPELFAHIGTTYGGNGTTTFGTPDGAGRALVGPGGDISGVAGNSGGATTHTLTVAQTPSHNHSTPSHSHSTPSHSHSMASHTHSINHDHGAISSGSGGGHGHTDSFAATTVRAEDHAHDTSLSIPSGHSYMYRSDDNDAASNTAIVNVQTGSGLALRYQTSASNSNLSGGYSGVDEWGVASSGHVHSITGAVNSASSHTHSVDLPAFNGTSGSGGATSTGSSGGTTGVSGGTTGSSGSTNSHNILQPYQVVGGLVIRT